MVIKAEYQHDLHLKQKVQLYDPTGNQHTKKYWSIFKYMLSSKTYSKKNILLEEFSDAIDYKNLNIVDVILAHPSNISSSVNTL